MILALLIVFSVLTKAEAHIIGVMPWCLASSPVHFECFQEDHELCEKTAQKRTTAFERWDCVPFPVDFRKIPKVGEALTNSEIKKPEPSPEKKIKDLKDKPDL